MQSAILSNRAKSARHAKLEFAHAKMYEMCRSHTICRQRNMCEYARGSCCCRAPSRRWLRRLRLCRRRRRGSYGRPAEMRVEGDHLVLLVDEGFDVVVSPEGFDGLERRFMHLSAVSWSIFCPKFAQTFVGVLQSDHGGLTIC